MNRSKAAERDQAGRKRDRQRPGQPGSPGHDVESPEHRGRRRALRGQRRGQSLEQPGGSRGKPLPERLGQQRDPADGRKRQDRADGVDLAGVRGEENEGGEPERLGRRDRAFEKTRREKHGHDEPRADRGRIGAADEDEEEDGREEHGVAALSTDARQPEPGEHEARRETDVQPGDHEQMVKPAAPVSRDHPAVELRRPAQEERVERPADVAIERLAAGALRREAAVEKPVRERQSGRARAVHAPQEKGRLHREAIAAVRELDIAGRSGEVLPPQMADQADPIAPVRFAFGGDGPRDEEKDLRRKRPPAPGDPEPFRPETAAGPRRGVAPEIRQDTLDHVDPVCPRRKGREGFLRGPVRSRDREPTLRESDARPHQEKRAGNAVGPFPPKTPEHENRTEERHEKRLPLPLRGPRSQEDSGDERGRRRKRGRFAGTGDGSDQEAPALRTRVTTDSTR